MRLLSIELNGFRGFAQTREFDLNADAIVVVGTNGHGKTSLFDGVLFALSGKVPRLGNETSRLLSLYSDAAEARVLLRFETRPGGERFAVTRTLDESGSSRIALETPSGIFRGPSAEGMLIDLLWHDAASATDPNAALADVLTQCIYLQQDVVRNFIAAKTPQECFTSVSELLGAGRIAEFQGSLERSKKAWSTATNQRQQEQRSFREELAMLDARVADLTVRQSEHPDLSVSIADWNLWWENLNDLGLTVTRTDLTARDAPVAIDSVIKQLDAKRLITERQINTLEALLVDIRGLASQTAVDTEVLRDQVAGLRSEVSGLQHALAEEQARLAERRHFQTALREKNEQLQALASLALQNLSDRCPICDQSYDRDSTRARLERLANAGQDQISADPTTTAVDGFSSLLTSREKELASAEAALKSATQLSNARQVSAQSIAARLSEFEIDADGNREVEVDKVVRVGKVLLESLDTLQQSGEIFALKLATASSVAGIEELKRKAIELQNDVETRERAITARNRTGDLAQRVIEALREAVSRLIEQRLKSINPLLQDIWTRIDPHPSFRAVRLLSEVVRGKGHLSTIIVDPINAQTSSSPSSVLSSSQVNALGLSIFLALNLGSTKPPLSVAILDDPLQSLDDLNLLGVVDLLRRTKDQRQLLVSTHDARFGDLLARKLRPTGGSSRTVIIELEGWARSGPNVNVREVKPDPVTLRLVS
jgi:DNA repair exonuclease SbcCD ATPase subunit